RKMAVLGPLEVAGDRLGLQALELQQLIGEQSRARATLAVDEPQACAREVAQGGDALRVAARDDQTLAPRCATDQFVAARLEQRLQAALEQPASGGQLRHVKAGHHASAI